MAPKTTKAPTATTATATPAVVDHARADREVRSARTALLLDQPFFGTLALRLTLVCDPTCPTAYTNGTVLGYNPTFVLKLTRAELIGLIVHEVMHCAMGHMWRRDTRDHHRFNVAADYAINGVLTESKFTLPHGGLLDEQYTGRSAEWIYDRLPPEIKTTTYTADGQSGHDGDDVRDAPSDGGKGKGKDDPNGKGGSASQESEIATEAGWKQAIVQAARAAQARGNLPAHIARWADIATQPKVDWRSVLHRFMQESARADYDWTQPNRRYISSGLYMPRLHSQQCGRFVIGIDTSGSIDATTLSQFCAELRAIIAEVRPSQTDVIYCDAAINQIDTYTPDDQIALTMKGGGGTSFVPVFDHVADDAPQCLVYFTDLMGTFPDVAPDYPVLWAVYGSYRDVSVPFGETVYLD